MLSQWEDSEIQRGLYDLKWNLDHLPITAVAHFIVEYDPELADKLANQISFNLFDKHQREIENGTK